MINMTRKPFSNKQFLLNAQKQIVDCHIARCKSGNPSIKLTHPDEVRDVQNGNPAKAKKRILDEVTKFQELSRQRRERFGKRD
jgi:hypothetical protein